VEVEVEVERTTPSIGFMHHVGLVHFYAARPGAAQRTKAWAAVTLPHLSVTYPPVSCLPRVPATWSSFVVSYPALEWASNFNVNAPRHHLPSR